MRLLIDTNVILDVAFQRPAFVRAGSAVVKLCQSQHQGWIAWHTLSNAFYLVRQHTKSSTVTMQFCQHLLSWASVSTVGHGDAIRAVSLGFSDVEDAMQAASAEACNADYIITRNTRDFAASPVPALTPDDFLARYHPGLPL